jgi:ribosome-binding ATPase YchF (GTP1/OBG family)
MKTRLSISIPLVFATSLILFLNSGSNGIYGQMMMNQSNMTNQTSQQNTTQQAQQQLQQAEQQMQQAQEKLQQSNQSKSQDPKMNEKLLNYTNAAILALNNNDENAAQQSLVQIQSALINASGKQVVVIPAPAVQPDTEEDESN